MAIYKETSENKKALRGEINKFFQEVIIKTKLLGILTKEKEKNFLKLFI